MCRHTQSNSCARLCNNNNILNFNTFSFFLFVCLQPEVFDEIDLLNLCFAECSTKNVNHSFQVCVFCVNLGLRWCSKLPWLQSFISHVCQNYIHGLVLQNIEASTKIRQLIVDGDEQMVANKVRCGLRDNLGKFAFHLYFFIYKTCQLIFHPLRYWCKRQGYDYSLYYTTCQSFLVFINVGLFTAIPLFELSFFNRKSLYWRVAEEMFGKNLNIYCVHQHEIASEFK